MVLLYLKIGDKKSAVQIANSILKMPIKVPSKEIEAIITEMKAVLAINQKTS